MLDLQIDDDSYPARIGPWAFVSVGMYMCGVCVIRRPPLPRPTHTNLPHTTNPTQPHNLVVNLPCVVEVHKTVDQVTLFKSGDVGQMVVVYGMCVLVFVFGRVTPT